MEIKVTSTLQVPKVPKSLTLSDGRRMRLGDLTDEQLDQVGEAYKQSLKIEAGTQRTAAKAEGNEAN